MAPKIALAKSCWPRSGYDRANSSHIKVSGPKQGKVILDINLPHQKKKKVQGMSGTCVVTDTNELRVLFNNRLYALGIDGTYKWSVKIKKEGLLACPVALKGGACLITFRNGICIYDALGRHVFERILDGYIFDDTGISPNISKRGEVIVGCFNEVLCIDIDGHKNLGALGYDIVPPAIYPDGTLAISGYSGEGFCRYETNGERVWKTKFEDADRLASINKNNQVAVSRTGSKAHFYSDKGKLLGKYSKESIFAEYSKNEWVARSDKYIAKVTTKGKKLWGYKLKNDSNWGHCQPIVDSEGRVYVLDAHKMLCFTGNGHLLFETKVAKASWGSLCSIAPERLAYVGCGRLQIIG